MTPSKKRVRRRKSHGALSSERHRRFIRVARSLALVTDHFEVGHSNVASFSRLLLLVLLSFALFLLGRFRPKRSSNRYLMTEMLREFDTLAAKLVDFPILSSDGILASLVTLLQTPC